MFRSARPCLAPHLTCLALLLLTATACGGGGGGGGGGDTGATTVSISGTLASVETTAVSASATPLPVAVVAVDETGRVADAVVTRGDFTLVLPVDHDYCILFRRRQVEGAALGVLLAAPGGRAVFHLGPGMAPIDLGAVTVHTSSGRAESAAAVAPDMVPPATTYRDTDHDLIPDAMDRDDDGDGVTDGRDCAPLDARRFLTLTTGSCVADDEDDDNDRVADTVDAFPLDPTRQVDSSSDPDVVKLLDALGHWTLSYTIISTFTDTFDFDLVQDTGNGVFASGTNEYGDFAVLGTAESAGYDYGIYTSGAIIGEAYFVNLTGATVTGEYWQTDPDTGEITSSRPYAILGSHTPLAVATSAIGPVGDPLAAQRRRAAEAAADPGYQPPVPEIQDLLRRQAREVE